ncbi:MAG TPA: hypothetical protein VN226_01120 [Anaerolineales bacterium]|nr:hypothetical protein [Anaerolineales bacterium]
MNPNLDFSFLSLVIGINQILTAGLSITAFSLLIYALSFNLRDRVAKSFAVILIAVVIIFTSEALESVSDTDILKDIFLRMQWIGLIILPSAYFHFSDALLVSVGRPSRGRRKLMVRAFYFVSALFLVALISGLLVGELNKLGKPTMHLQRTALTNVFSFFYVSLIALTEYNFVRSYLRAVTSSGKRRLFYLLSGASFMAIGSFPFTLYGSSFAANYELLFWSFAAINNIMVGSLLVMMAYVVAFFGVSWPDRIVKARLLKWLMRGPVAASIGLTAFILVRRAGEAFGLEYTSLAPASMAATFMLAEHMITLLSPYIESFLFYGQDKAEIKLFENFEERFLTQEDLTQFLETELAAMQDLLGTKNAFLAIVGQEKIKTVLHNGEPFFEQDRLAELLQQNIESGKPLIPVGEDLLIPIWNEITGWEESKFELLGLFGIHNAGNAILDEQQLTGIQFLADRAAVAIMDRNKQLGMIASLQKMAPEVSTIQKIRASGRIEPTNGYLASIGESEDIIEVVRDALTHYWGGPKLTNSPLARLRVTQRLANREFEGNVQNAMRALLKQAVNQIRPSGDRKFTTEWILFNILEMKFFEGKKVRDVALRLAMSEADLYRKQRVAVEAVTEAILKMENELPDENEPGAENSNSML